MNFNNRIRSLHQTDEATAQTIMQQCPAQWDMEKVFRKTYQSYLFQKQEGAAFAGECTEALPCPNVPRSFRGLWKAGAYTAFAAAFLGLFLFIFRMDGTAPPVDRFPDGIHENDVPRLDIDSQVEETTTYETQPDTIATTDTESSSEATEHTTPSVSETAETTIIEITPPLTTEEQIPDPTEVMTVPPVTETEAPAVTGTPTPESTAPETTTTTTEPPVIPLGHFEVSEQSGSFSQITYVREDTAPVEEHEHSFAAEGFTLTNTSVQNPDYPFRSVIFNLEDGAGQHYMVQQHRYDYFAHAYNTSIAWQTRSYTIGGRTVFLVYQDDPESVCSLMWDDGCHISVMNSQYKDLANMELLMQGMITN